jgi:hypothetical protein
MTSEDPRITARVAQACDKAPSVTEAVRAQMDQLLKGELSERALSSTRLSAVAKLLIASMAPEVPKAETLL